MFFCASAQIHQFDRRWIFGLKGERRWRVSDRLDLAVGAENRWDDIRNVGVQHTADRVLVESFGLYRVQEASGSLYAEATLHPTERLRITGGVRGDYYHYDVRANDAAAAALGESRSACTTMEFVPLAGFSIQKLVKAGNSSPFGSAVLIDNPRADMP